MCDFCFLSFFFCMFFSSSCLSLSLQEISWTALALHWQWWQLAKSWDSKMSTWLSQKIMPGLSSARMGRALQKSHGMARGTRTREGSLLAWVRLLFKE